MRALVVYCHPCEESLVAAARDAAVRGLEAGGHDVRLIDLYAEEFRPELAADEWRGHAEGVRDDDCEPHFEALRWAEAIVFVYPTWWGMQPAMLRGWLDRVWTTGVAYDITGDLTGIAGRLKHIRRLVVITTHGSSKLQNSLQGESGKRLVGRGLRVLCHPLARTRWIALYGVDACSDQERRDFLSRVERRLSRRRL